MVQPNLRELGHKGLRDHIDTHGNSVVTVIPTDIRLRPSLLIEYESVCRAWGKNSYGLIFTSYFV